MSFLKKTLQKIAATFQQDEVSSAVTRMRRRRAFTTAFVNQLLTIRIILYLVGFGWLLVLPSPLLGRGIYIDENALQPGQVSTHWDWGDVNNADRYLAEVERLRDRNATSIERAYFFLSEFQKLGIPAEIQSYTFESRRQKILGHNVYAISPSPRTSGTEAMVISAPWLSQSGDDIVNARGISILLALAKFLKKYSLWAKDLIFVVSDGSLDGMYAFLNAYHGSPASSWKYDDLNITSGTIWTALNVDYPGHSFSELGILHEGLNGRLPNQDLINSFTFISDWTARVPVTLYDTTLKTGPFPTLQKLMLKQIVEQPAVQEYLRRARNILRHASYQTIGKPSGVHGLFHRYRIDAFTIYAIPDVGPHGFHSLGMIMESTLRTANNLLERLHASFFFYILTTPTSFLKVGHYLPSVLMISVATLIGALNAWVASGWVELGPQKTWTRRDRPVLAALRRMGISHIAGYAIWYLSTIKARFPVVAIFSMSIIIGISVLPSKQSGPPPCHWLTLKSLTLSLSSAVLSITTLLNFSLSALLSVALLPLIFARPTPIWPVFCAAIALGSRLLRGTDVSKHWELFGVWFEPFYYLVYVPFLLEGAMICSMPSVK